MPIRKGINISGNYAAPHILHVIVGCVLHGNYAAPLILHVIVGCVLHMT